VTDQAEPSRYRLEPIAEHYEVSLFDCQHTYLNLFLREKALAETRSGGYSLTFALLDISSSPAFVAGYFMLRADSYYVNANQGASSIPVVELVCLARDITRRGQGIGDILLMEALRNVKEAAERIGIAGLHLAYTDEGKKLYDRYQFGKHPLSYRTDLLFLPNQRYPPNRL